MPLPKKKISLVLSLFLLTSCYESLDFDQINDYVFKPVFTTALTYFKVVPAQFFDSSGTIQQTSVSEVSDFQIFNNNFFSENIVKIVFNSEMKNEFDRDVTILFELLNGSNNTVYSFTPIFVESNSINPPPFIEEIIIASNPNIANATQVRITAKLENTGVQMDLNDTSEFEFKSAITYYSETEF